MAHNKKKGQSTGLEVDRRGPRQRVWEAIRWLSADPGHFTLDDLSAQAKVGKVTVKEVCWALEKAGYVRRKQGHEKPKPGLKLMFELLRDNGVEMPRVRKDGRPSTHGLAQEQMWRTLGLLSGDTNDIELAAHASTPSVSVTPAAAYRYLLWLEKSGFVQRTKEAKSGAAGWRARFRLLRRTGPRPPVILEVRAVYDPNTHEVVYTAPTSAEEAVDVCRA